MCSSSNLKVPHFTCHSTPALWQLEPTWDIGDKESGMMTPSGIQRMLSNVCGCGWLGFAPWASVHHQWNRLDKDLPWGSAISDLLSSTFPGLDTASVRSMITLAKQADGSFLDVFCLIPIFS